MPGLKGVTSSPVDTGNTTSGPSLDGINIAGTENEYIAFDLQILSSAGNYRRMLYSQIEGALGKRIVEVGSGIGSYTELLVDHGRVWANEIEEEFIQFLSKRFAGNENIVIGKFRLGSMTPADFQAVSAFSPDTFVCMNVLEHIQDDVSALREMTSCLPVGGHVAVIVPAIPALFCALDRKYGHYRRYSKHSVVEAVSRVGNAALVHCQYFNFPGIVGWWFNHVLLKREALPPHQTLIYDKCIVPVVHYLEKIIAPPLGLSIVFWIRRTA